MKAARMSLLALALGGAAPAWATGPQDRVEAAVEATRPAPAAGGSEADSGAPGPSAAPDEDEAPATAEVPATVEAPAPADPDAGSPIPGLLAELTGEAAALRSLLTPARVLQLGLLLLVALLLFAGLQRLTRAVRRAGYDVDRRLIVIPLVAATLLTLWVAGVLGRFLLLRTPLLATGLLAAFGATLLVALAWRLHRATAGALLTVRGRLREGDRVTVGEESGTVEGVGPMHLTLRRDDGAAVYIPLAGLDGQSVTVSSPSRAQPVRIVLQRQAALTRDERERLRAVALFCPYREAGTAVRLDEDPTRPGRIELHLQAWSAAAAEAARDWLHQRIE